MTKHKIEPEPEKPCTCTIENGRCASCWELLTRSIELYQKATLEYLARIEWIGAAMRPPCEPCVSNHADALAEKVVIDVISKLARPMRREVWNKMVVVLLHAGVTSFPKSAAAYRRLDEIDLGKLTSIDELLKALYGRG